MPTIRETKKELARLIAKAERGEEVIITRGRQPVARLVPIARPRRRELGIFEGMSQVGPEFFDPLPEEELCPVNEENK